MEKITNRTFALNWKIGKRRKEEEEGRKVVSRSRQDFGDLKFQYRYDRFLLNVMMVSKNILIQIEDQ